MLRGITLGLVTVCWASSASAQWEASAGYTHVDTALHNLGAAVVGVGYQFPINNAWSVIPTARIGYGIKDGTLPVRVGDMEDGEPVTYVYDADISINNFYALQLRTQFYLNNGIYLFAAPSYTDLGLKINGNQYDRTERDDGFGIGAGAGFRINDSLVAEASYEETNAFDSELIGVKLRFTF